MTDDVLSLCKEFSEKSDSTNDYKSLEKHCWLTFGSLLKGLCYKHKKIVNEFSSLSKSVLLTKKEKEYFDRKCPRTLLDKYSEEYKVMLRKVSSWPNRKDFLIHSISNSYVLTSTLFKELSEIIRNKNEHIDVRTSTIFTYLTTGNKLREEVTSLLTPIFKDRREDPVIRASSFISLILSNIVPTNTPTILSLVEDLKNEPCELTKAFVYNTIMSFSNTSSMILNSEWRDLLMPVSHMIKDIRINPNLKAGMYRFDKIFPEYNIGLFSDILVVPSRDSRIPRLFQHGNFLQIKDFFVPTSFTGFSLDGINQIFNKLSEKFSYDKSYKMDDKPFHFHTNVMKNFQTVFSGIVDEKELMDFITEPSRLYDFINKLREGLKFSYYGSLIMNIHNQVPCPNGIFVDTNITIIPEMRLKMDLKTEVRPEPSLMSFWKVPEKIDIKSKLLGSKKVYVHSMMGPRLPFLLSSSKVLLKFEGKLPMNMIKTVDLPNKIIHMKIKNLNKEVKLVTLKVEPNVCLIKRSPRTSSWTYESRPIITEEKCERRSFVRQYPSPNYFKSPISLKVKGSVPSKTRRHQLLPP
jgi:hypothetical protein